MPNNERWSKRNGFTSTTTAGVSFSDGTVKTCEARFSKTRILWVRLNGKCVYPKDYEKHGIKSVRLNFIPYP